MFKLFWLLCFFISPAFSQTFYTKHWPLPLPFKNLTEYPLISHHIFTLQFNTHKKFPVYVAYHLSPQILWGDLKAKRDYTLDPYLQDQSLSNADFKGASNCDGKSRSMGYDRGHLAPVGSFKNSVYIYEAQYMSNIVPQKVNLNQGPWRVFEEKARDFIKKGNELYILAGPLYGKEGNKIAPCWKAAQSKIEELPNRYFKMALDFKNKKLCSVIMPQDITHRQISLKRFQVPLQKIEQESGLTFWDKNKLSVTETCQFLF